MKLIVCESPNKIKKIKEYAGPGFAVVASYGHVIDLPDKSIGVDVKKDFAATFEVKKDKEQVLANILSQASKAEIVYLMTDEDREGEGISQNIRNHLGKIKTPIKRASTNEITKTGIQKAIANAGEIDMGKVNAYLTRRILDRLAGYKTSFLTQQATGGRSAGRVQSAVLRIIAEREKEILAFKPEEYWILTGHFKTAKKELYSGVAEKLPNETAASTAYDAIMAGKPVVVTVEKKEHSVSPSPPFTALHMIAAASNHLHWSAEKTMKMAQSLFEGALITYHRSDSTFIAAEAMTSIRGFISHSYGDKYLTDQPKVYVAKKGAQEAHECCRVTDVNNIEPTGIGDDERKLYRMIWKRTISCQMTNGRDEKVKVVTRVADYDFTSSGSRLLFDGFRKVWDYSNADDKWLPDLTVGEAVELQSLDKEQKFTTPPPRYSDASLCKICEKEQIGRPSTFSSCIKTLTDRGYIKREKKSFSATELGIRVVDFLIAADFCFVDVKFTAQMEELLDEIQEGKKDKTSVLSDFWARLQKDIDSGKKVKEHRQLTNHKCPKCSAFLMLKHSQFGPFYSCQNYKPKSKAKKPKPTTVEGCSYTALVGPHGEPVEKPPPKPKEYATFPCKCGAQMIKREGKFGAFYGCSKWPACKQTAALDGTFKEFKPKWQKWKKKAKPDLDQV